MKLKSTLACLALFLATMSFASGEYKSEAGFGWLLGKTIKGMLVSDVEQIPLTIVLSKKITGLRSGRLLEGKAIFGGNKKNVRFKCFLKVDSSFDLDIRSYDEEVKPAVISDLRIIIKDNVSLADFRKGFKIPIYGEESDVPTGTQRYAIDKIEKSYYTSLNLKIE